MQHGGKTGKADQTQYNDIYYIENISEIASIALSGADIGYVYVKVTPTLNLNDYRNNDKFPVYDATYECSNEDKDIISLSLLTDSKVKRIREEISKEGKKEMVECFL